VSVRFAIVTLALLALTLLVLLFFLRNASHSLPLEPAQSVSHAPGS
jgi:hypothetical protein